MNFTIVTPSFNQLEHLKRCVASVADQVGSLCESVDRCSMEVAREIAAKHAPITDSGRDIFWRKACYLIQKSKDGRHDEYRRGEKADCTGD